MNCGPDMAYRFRPGLPHRDEPAPDPDAPIDLDAYRMRLPRFLTANQIGDFGLLLTVRSLERVIVYQRDGLPSIRAWGLRFEGERRILQVNRGNLLRLAQLLGDDSDDWPGQMIVLYTEPVKVCGQRLRGIRIRRPTGRGARPVTAPRRPITGALDPEP